jgi:hypothetical protein
MPRPRPGNGAALLFGIARVVRRAALPASPEASSRGAPISYLARFQLLLFTIFSDRYFFDYFIKNSNVVCNLLRAF